MGFHMVRDLDQNEKLGKAIEKAGLNFIPWLNQSAVLKRDTSKGKNWVKDPPYDCDVLKLETEIAKYVPADAEYAYLDIESPMREPFSARSLAVYQDAIGIAKEVRNRTKWGIYSMVHKPLGWRTPGVSWGHWLNSLHMLTDFSCISVYPRSGHWTDSLDERWWNDLRHSDLIINNDMGLQGFQGRLAFVRPRWASNGGDGQFVPIEWFRRWIDMLNRDGIAICLFMNKHEQENMLEEFLPYIHMIGELESTPNET